MNHDLFVRPHHEPAGPQPHLSALFREGGAFLLRCAPECLTEDPERAAEALGLRLAAVSLLNIEDPAKGAAMLRAAASNIRSDGRDAVLVLNADFPLLAARSAQEAARTAGWLEACCDALTASGAHAVLLLTVLDGLAGLNADKIGCRRLTDTPDGLALSGLSKADIGLRCGREALLLCERRGMTADLFELELRERFEAKGRYLRPQIEDYLQGGSGDCYPALLQTPAARRLIERSGAASPDGFAAVFSVDPADVLMLTAFQMLETCGLMTSERGPTGRTEFRTPNRSAVKMLAALLMASVTEPDSDWIPQAQRLAEALRTGDPNACSQAADALFSMAADDAADGRPEAYLAAALAAIGLEVTVDEQPQTVGVRLPGGLRELVLAEPGDDPADLGSPETPRIILTLG